MRSPKVRRQRSQSFESRLSGFLNKEEKQGRSNAARPEEKVVSRKLRHGSGGGFEIGENKRKLDEQRKMLQKELRDIEKLSLIPQEIQCGLKEGLEQQLQDI